MVKEFADNGLRLGHLQLDSWWYTKAGDPNAKPPLNPSWKQTNYAHGIYLYQAAPELFPDGLSAFQKTVSLPLVTHSRWIDPTSPYAQSYKLSHQVAIDPLYWDMVMKYLHENGVRTYEQDWLNQKGLPRLDRIEDADLFLDTMSTKASKYGVNLQYCMPLPRHFLQASKYSNLFSIRTSGDGFERGKWSQFLYGSRLASALGIWPWTDVFFSQDRESVLIATLSGGIIGVGDRLGSDSDTNNDYNKTWCAKSLNCRTLNKDNLQHTMRTDGVIVKPDFAIVPTDDTYLSQYLPSAYPKAVLATARTMEGGNLTAVYLFSYATKNNSTTDITIDPKKLGFDEDVYLYRYFDDKGELIVSGKTAKATVNSTGSYFVLVPSDTLAILGDLKLFVPMGRKRVYVKETSNGHRTLNVILADTENAIVLTGYSWNGKPEIDSAQGFASLAFDMTTKKFKITVTKPSSATGQLWNANVTLSE